LVTDRPRPPEISYEGSNIFFEIDANLGRCLRSLAKELKVSLYSVLLSGYYLMLSVFSNEEDIILGIPVANRHHRQTENLIGFFVNTLALRVKIDKSLKIKEFIEKIGEELIDAQLHQDLPFEKLVEELVTEKDRSRHPIFQVMFGIDNFGWSEEDKTNENKVSIKEILEEYKAGEDLYKIAKFDLSLFIDDREDILKGYCNYSVNLYKEETIKSFLRTYKNILEELGKLTVNDNDLESLKIADLKYLSNEEHRLVVEEWNKTDKEYSQDKTISELFEEQVERTPENIAVVYEESKLTYKELNERANQLAHYMLREHNLKLEELVALCLDRSEDMLISILAVLKAGCAYVPIDPAYPDERVRYILEDTGARLILTDKSYQERLEALAPSGRFLLPLDNSLFQAQLELQASTNPVTSATSSNLAYVIYTSGTTGKPKGVMIENRGVVNRIEWMNKLYPLSFTDKILQKTPIFSSNIQQTEFLSVLLLRHVL
jgi:non-ribosomal peptide synthetase component F